MISPPQHSEINYTLYDLDRLEVDLVLGSRVGWRYYQTPDEHKITQLLGDSATFNFSDYLKRMDLVFVDGSHAIEYVRSDTENAFKMICSGAGVIIWHDYGDEFPDVRTYLNGLAENRRDYRFYHFLHTLLVACVKSKK